MLNTVLIEKGLNPNSVHYTVDESVMRSQANGHQMQEASAAEAITEHVGEGDNEDGGIYL